MDRSTYAAEAVVEATHWWFVGRRRLFVREISRMKFTSHARILDVGTSTGTNLRMLREHGFHKVVGVDFSLDAIRFCAEKGLGVVHHGDVCNLPFDDEVFDLVLATDIIEHVEDDDRALQQLCRVTRPGGVVLITVPAFENLWGLQDVVSHHKRRYQKKELNRKIAASGLEVCRSYFFNFLLFAPIWLARQIIRLLRIPLKSENEVNGPMLNGILTAMFEVDCRLAPVLRPPFGVSILTVARRP